MRGAIVSIDDDDDDDDSGASTAHLIHSKIDDPTVAYLAIEISTNCLLRPGLVVEISSPFLLGISSNIGHSLTHTDIIFYGHCSR